MLGRLFRQNLQTSLGSTSQTGNAPLHASQNINSYEDLYTREILYGTGDSSQLRPPVLQNKHFRLIVAQDGGSLRQKQVLYDSAGDTPERGTRPSLSRADSKTPPLVAPLPRKNHIISSKSHHNAGELNDYMFGCGLPSNESNSTSKLHILPALNLVNAVLITKLFLIAETYDCGDFDELWAPLPALPTKETAISGYPFAQAHSRQAGKTGNINSRFSIGLIIPLDLVADLTDVVLNNWHEIAHYLIVLQKLVVKKLIAVLNTSSGVCGCPYIVNRRIQFPNSVLQGEVDLGLQLVKLVKLVHYNSQTPKLINSNSLIKHAIHTTGSQFNPMLLNWVLEVLNWLEFKDGKAPQHPSSSSISTNFGHNSQFHNLSPSHEPPAHSASHSSFLASLFAVLIPLRELLRVKPFSGNSASKTKEVTRIVIMTGNAMVAKKLVFIINGLIPDIEFLCSLEGEADGSKYHQKSQENAETSNFSSGSDQDIKNPRNGPQNAQNDSPKNEISQNFSSNSSNSSSSTVGSPESDLKRKSTLTRALKGTRGFEVPLQSPQELAHASFGSFSPEKPGLKTSPTPPISINTVIPTPRSLKSLKSPKSPHSLSSSEHSFSHSIPSLKGWEIPSKSMVSTGNARLSSRVETSTKTIPIQASLRRSSLLKSSSLAYLSSSLTSSLLSSASNYSLSKFGGSFMEKWKTSFSGPGPLGPSNGFDSAEYVPPPSVGSLSKRTSIQSLRTPSPAVEVDDFAWNMSNTALGSFTPAQGSVQPSLSRTQSMFDLYHQSNGERRPGNSHEEDNLMGQGLRRTPTSVYTPIIHDDGVKNVAENNLQVVRQKCAAIMASKAVISETRNGNTLRVEPLKAENESASQIFKKTPLLPSVAFIDDFRPEFTIQSCPMNAKLEAHILAAMKNDLLFYQNNCDYKKVDSRTILVSLRAREIKLIEMCVGGDVDVEAAVQRRGSEASLPKSFLLDGRHPNSSYKTSVKKIFTPYKTGGDRGLVALVENTLDEMARLFAENYGKGGGGDSSFNGELSRLLQRVLERGE